MKIIASLFLSLYCAVYAPRQQFKDQIPDGFVYVKISELARANGVVEFLKNGKDTVFAIDGSYISFQGEKYHIINDEYKYKSLISIDTFSPEYDLFIMKCYGKKGDSYVVEIDKKKAYVKLDSDFIVFKDMETYMLDTFPISTVNNPLPFT